MKKLIMASICAAFLASTSSLYAEETTNTTEQGTAEAYDMLEAMHMDKTYTDMIDKMLQSQSAMLPAQVKNNKKMMKEFNNIMGNFMHKYLSWDIIKDDMAELYAKHYTVEELKDIKAFYLTPTGQKTIEIMPQVMAESIQLSQSKVMPHIGEMQKQIMDLVKSETKSR